MSEFEKNMNEILNLDKPKDEPKPKPIAKVTYSPDEDDFEVARNNIKELLRQGDEALYGILDLARTSEHPRSYEVAGQLIKTLVDANKDLMTLHKQKKDLAGKSEDDLPRGTNIQQAVFVGTTAELLELKNKK